MSFLKAIKLLRRLLLRKSGPLTFSFVATQNVTLTHIIYVEEIKPDIHTPIIKEVSKGLFPVARKDFFITLPSVINVSSTAAECTEITDISFIPDGIFNMLLISIAWHRCKRPHVCKISN